MDGTVTLKDLRVELLGEVGLVPAPLPHSRCLVTPDVCSIFQLVEIMSFNNLITSHQSCCRS
jgi:hypothetical protein